MSTYGFFQTAVLGMESQSHSLAATADNIANVRTGGYKRTDVHFATVLSRTLSSQPGAGDSPAGTWHSDVGGVVPFDHHRVSLQGAIEATDRPLDVAISGDGMFVLNPAIDGSETMLYGRDGRLSLSVVGDEAYLADKNGLFVMGWQADPLGVFPTDPEALTAIRVDPDAFADVGAPTSRASLALNLPAAEAPGAVELYAIDAYDAAGQVRDLHLSFTKDSAHNTWLLGATAGAGDVVTLGPPSAFSLSTTADQEVVFDSGAGTIGVRTLGAGAPAAGAFAVLAPGDPLSVSGNTLNQGTYTVIAVAADGSAVSVAASPPLTAEVVTDAIAFGGTAAQWHPLGFGADGYLDSPSHVTVQIDHADGQSTAFDLDLSLMTQFGGPFTPINYQQDGFAASDLGSIEIDGRGQVVGLFESGQSKPLYKLALGDFVNADLLDPRNGNVYAATEAAGPVTIGVAGEAGLGTLLPAAHEVSNVDLAHEFSMMIVAQNAYNASATSFRTMDEMTEVARDLKQ
jgi:flagellar hook protein FlgE